MVVVDAGEDNQLSIVAGVAKLVGPGKMNRLDADKFPQVPP